MRAREKLLGIPRQGETRGLVYPVVYNDGDSFPEEARVVKSRFDLSKYGFPYEQFSRTEAYLEFHVKVNSIAADLACGSPPPRRGNPDGRCAGLRHFHCLLQGCLGWVRHDIWPDSHMLLI